MLRGIQKLIRTTDAAVARAYLSFFRERAGLLPFLFHSLFDDPSQIALDVIDPLEKTTVAQFRQLVEYYAKHGYRFVAPEEVLAGLPLGGKYALLTFDDGYYNNTLALPVLEEFNAPALFFISTDHVRLGKCFWWDVLHRERVARGASLEDIARERRGLKRLTSEKIEKYLVAEFGPAALDPRGDIDRPFTPTELREFSRHRCVRLGNHTANHAILTNYSDAEVRSQVGRAQEWLSSTTGLAPSSIAYPNGGYDDSVVRACGEVGLKMGFTVRPRKTPLPIDTRPGELLRIGRFTPHAESGIDEQCRTYRSDLQLYGAFRSGYLKLAGRQETQ